MHNYDGDLLFSCSDDSTICMYDTKQLVRIGVFNVKEACRSIDLTKDSKYIVASATTYGINVYECLTGKLVARVEVPGMLSKQVSFAFGDKQLFCLHDVDKRSYLRLFEFSDILASGVSSSNEAKCIQQIDGSKDYLYTVAVWGPRNQCLIIATNQGKVFMYDLNSKAIISEEPVHSAEIYALELTPDYSMLLTGSKDGTAKLLNPETFEVVRSFDYGKPCRSITLSPLYEDPKFQKFHVICAGGQDAKDVTTTSAE